ncbi:hypothetical protein [Bartonella henselae]|uniref:hypothetical protein n=1 Tax=Bartonella henselae TaxID=38323 RepID=UPI0002D7847C|nr:hypothetical protein [Bartonella henselae]MDM9984057.1 hypothetical protein [Bartonella henselae]MDM9985332.1 hypothetical protein [Bartonella henselae]MDM9987057.1 hypothetical protein [Bartonella henselae]MDM9988273.1 hypothetical protein [Bartonella henselae]MDM9989809.1 hypothetical protein [Bartonella henselae]
MNKKLLLYLIYAVKHRRLGGNIKSVKLYVSGVLLLDLSMKSVNWCTTDLRKEGWRPKVLVS